MVIALCNVEETGLQQADRSPHVQANEQLLQLLFHANLTTDGWDRFLQAFAQHFDLRSCHLYAYNPQTMDIRFQEWAGTPPNPHFYQLYVEEYIHLDPLQAALHQRPLLEFYSTSLHTPINEIENSKFFINWCDPQDILAGSACAFIREESLVIAINHTRSHRSGHYTQQEIAELNALTPFIQKALNIRLKIASGQEHNTRLQELADQLPFPAAMVNEFGEAIVINNQMKTLFFDKGCFHIAATGQVDFGETEITRDMYINITESICQGKGTSLVYTPEEVIYQREEQPFSLLTESLVEHDEKQQRFIGAIVYAIDLNQETAIDAKKLCELFDFTPSEASCCAKLTQGKTIKQIARELKKSPETASEQLSNCYRKSNTQGQLELISLILAIPG